MPADRHPAQNKEPHISSERSYLASGRNAGSSFMIRRPFEVGTCTVVLPWWWGFREAAAGGGRDAGSSWCNAS